MRRVFSCKAGDRPVAAQYFSRAERSIRKWPPPGPGWPISASRPAACPGIRHKRPGPSSRLGRSATRLPWAMMPQEHRLRGHLRASVRRPAGRMPLANGIVVRGGMPSAIGRSRVSTSARTPRAKKSGRAKSPTRYRRRFPHAALSARRAIADIYCATRKAPFEGWVSQDSTHPTDPVTRTLSKINV